MTHYLVTVRFTQDAHRTRIYGPACEFTRQGDEFTTNQRHTTCQDCKDTIAQRGIRR